MCAEPAARPKRLLLLIPTSTYRTEDFVEAARRLDVDLVVASERPNVMAGEFPDHLLTVPFDDPPAAEAQLAAYARARPIDAVVPVDDVSVLAGAVIAAALGLKANPVAAVRATRNKLEMRELLAKAEVPAPSFAAFPADEDPAAVAGRVRYPCVLKPLVLSASRGVIRADDAAGFVAAWRRLAAILAEPEVRALGDGAGQILVEAFVPGVEVALEGLLSHGELNVLALFFQHLLSVFLDRVVFALPSVFAFAPARFDQTLVFHSMQNRVKHPVCTVQLATRAGFDLLNNGVTVTLPFIQQRQNQRFSGGGHQFFSDHKAQYIGAICMSTRKNGRPRERQEED